MSTSTQRAGTPGGGTTGGSSLATGAGSDPRPIPQLVEDAVADLRAIAEDERELAKAEIAVTARNAGIGAGLVAAALSLLGLGAVFLLVAVAEALVAAGLPRWAAWLVVGGAMVLLAVVLALVGVALLRRVGPPRRTIATARSTVQRTVAQVRTLGRPRRTHLAGQQPAP